MRSRVWIRRSAVQAAGAIDRVELCLRCQYEFDDEMKKRFLNDIHITLPSLFSRVCDPTVTILTNPKAPSSKGDHHYDSFPRPMEVFASRSVFQDNESIDFRASETVPIESQV